MLKSFFENWIKDPQPEVNPTPGMSFEWSPEYNDGEAEDCDCPLCQAWDAGVTTGPDYYGNEAYGDVVEVPAEEEEPIVQLPYNKIVLEDQDEKLTLYKDRNCVVIQTEETEYQGEPPITVILSPVEAKALKLLLNDL